MNLPLPMLHLGLHGRLGRIRILSIDRILLAVLAVGLRVLDLVLGDLYIQMDLGVLALGYLLVYIQEEAMMIKKGKKILTELLYKMVRQDRIQPYKHHRVPSSHVF